uniref:NOG1 N-terminal helical domain-containing protein n=1 Tax=Sarcophilus harrisii TaxID=9305 RepID=A0A7N4UX20_SARHA
IHFYSILKLVILPLILLKRLRSFNRILFYFLCLKKSCDDHYKLALGQINIAKNLLDKVAKDYVQLMKYGDSLYCCKQLKCTKQSLDYLEQVHQHLLCLPTIDSNSQTLLLCRYANVGKPSFINKVTRAYMDVQSYAFTIKPLFVGHMDYKYLLWQGSTLQEF